MIKSLHPLVCASIVIDKSNVTHRVDMGKTVEVPWRTFLIRTDDENILFECGGNPEIVQQFIDIGRPVTPPKDGNLVEQLGNMGVKPDDISTVILSHMHFEHCGMVTSFPNAEFVVQRAEYAYAINPPPSIKMYYHTEDYDSPDIKWKLIDGDTLIRPDMKLLLTKGHTPGSQSLVFDLPKTGRVILCGDAFVCAENIENEVITGIHEDPVEQYYSLRRIKMLVETEKASYFTSHDPDWRSKPDEYF